VLSLVQRLDPASFDVTVVMPDLLLSQKHRFEAAGARVVLLPIRKLIWPISAVTGLIAEIRRIKPDLVHVHSQEAGLTARVLAYLGGARTIFYTPHTINIRRKHLQSFYLFCERILAHITDRIISVNETDRQSLMNIGIAAEKLITVYNGVDLARFNAQTPPFASAAALHPLGNPLVMQVGRMNEQKAPFDFIEGARLVLQEAPDTHFVMLGDGPMLELVKQKIQTYDLEQSIVALGDQPDAYRWIREADIVTLTSNWEGSPYSVLEAMAWCKPVVTTSVNGCPELVLDGETGYLAPRGNTQEWADRVIRLLQDPQTAQDMGNKGRKHLEINFTLPTMVAKLSALYMQAANEQVNAHLGNELEEDSSNRA
jgi:glycosyltransferase involved in cell wall biosynthesis